MKILDEVYFITHLVRHFIAWNAFFHAWNSVLWHLETILCHKTCFLHKNQFHSVHDTMKHTSYGTKSLFCMKCSMWHLETVQLIHIQIIIWPFDPWPTCLFVFHAHHIVMLGMFVHYRDLITCYLSNSYCAVCHNKCKYISVSLTIGHRAKAVLLENTDSFQILSARDICCILVFSVAYTVVS